MKSKISKQGNHEKIIEVNLTEEELTPYFETIYRKYQKKIRLQGFRKGKVPLGLIKKLYGEEIKNEAIDEVVQKVFKEVSQKENLRPVAPAKLQNVDYKRDEGLHFKAIVEVMPEIELHDYKGLTVEREIYEVGEEDVAASLEDVREQMAVMQPVEEGEGAVDNNYILADLQEIDATGVPLVGKKFENQFFQLSKIGTNKEITEQLIGVKPGETRRVEMLPIIDGEGNENKKEIYNVNVKEIKVKQLPDLDDELGKDVSKFETLEELKADIKKKLVKQAQVNAKRKFRQRMIDEILKRNDFDLPEVMIDNYLDALVENATKESKQKIDEEVLKKEYRPHAIWNLKWELVKGKIAEIEQITVSDSDKDEFVSRIAEARGMEEKQLRRSLLNNKKAKERFEDEILETKVLDLVEKNAQIEDKKVTWKDIENSKQLALSM